MKRLLLICSATLAVLFGLQPLVYAANQTGASRPSGATAELVGYDVSYPQCGKSLPSDFYFAVIGVNGGNAASENPCLAAQLRWATGAKSGSKQSTKQLYVNTANPGQYISDVETWPKTAYDANGNLPPNPYGEECAGDNDLACSWLYGWNRAIYSESVFYEAANNAKTDNQTANYTWWLDVETMNTWQAGSNAALQRNVATLEAMALYFQLKGATVGLYSTAYQWGVITGNFVGSTSPLAELGNWRPSGSSLKNAVANCSVAPLTPGGFISMTQYTQKNLDKNHSCI